MRYLNQVQLSRYDSWDYVLDHGLHDAIVQPCINKSPLIAKHGHRDSFLVHQESLGRVKLEGRRHGCPNAHDTQGWDDFSFTVGTRWVCSRIREVKHKVETKAISLIEAAACKVFRCWCEQDIDSRELLFESLLNIIVIGAAADAWALNADSFLEDLDSEEG